MEAWPDALLVDERVAGDAAADGQREREVGGAARPARAAHEHDPGGDGRDAGGGEARDVLAEREHADQQHEHGRGAPRGGVHEPAAARAYAVASSAR